MMQGVPVVACRDGGGVLDIVPATGAGRVSEPTPQGVSAALRDLLAEPDSRSAAAAAGQGWRTRLSPDFVAERCEGWYRRALHG
jgi:hypothetical protein